jgi:hypothetical protein
MRSRWVLIVAVAIARAAHADGIVLESHAGPRANDANRWMAPLFDELSHHGFTAGGGVGRKYELAVSRVALTPDGLPTTFADQLENGHKAWIEGRFDDAVKLLRPLGEAARANPGAFAQNQPLRDRLLKGLIALALSQQKTGDAGGTRATFDEILRSFPDTQLQRTTYGAEAATLFEDLRMTGAAGGLGGLDVKPETPSAVVFVNEHFETVGTVKKDGLLPGDYRVYVQVGKLLSRSHRVAIRANERSTVAIDTTYDAALHTSPGWTGLFFGNAGEREQHETAYAARFANELGAGAVVIVGFDQVRGHAALFGALVDLESGRDIRRASIALRPEPPASRVRALARFLTGEAPTAELDVERGGETAAVELPLRDAAAPHARWTGWKWVAAGGAVAALGTGGVLLAIDGTCAEGAPPCPQFWKTALPGWLSIGGGVALGAVAVYLFLHQDSPASRSAYVVPTDGGAMAGFATAF